MKIKKGDKPGKKQQDDPAKKRIVEPGRTIPEPPKKKHIMEDPEVKTDHIISKKNKTNSNKKSGDSNKNQIN